MLELKSRTWEVLTPLVLLMMLLCASASCKLGGGGSGLDEANKLDQSATEDRKEIERIVRENKGKESEVTRAVNAGDNEGARRLMDESLQAMDRGLERARAAADKFDRASKLDVEPTIKEYLTLRAQAVAKAVEAFTELRKGVAAYRDGLGQTDRAAAQKGRAAVRRASETFDALIAESQKLDGQADDIARRNPDRIKPGS